MFLLQLILYHMLYIYVINLTANTIIFYLYYFSYILKKKSIVNICLVLYNSRKGKINLERFSFRNCLSITVNKQNQYVMKKKIKISQTLIFFSRLYDICYILCYSLFYSKIVFNPHMFQVEFHFELIFKLFKLLLKDIS